MTGLEIAVIGMSGKFPGADTINEYWNNIIRGKESITFYSKEQLQNSGIEKEILESQNYIRAKGVIKDSDCFDAAFFNIKEDEAKIMDPQLRLLLECSWSALEDAGYSYKYDKGTVGVYIGTSSSFEWRSNILKNKNYNALDKYKISLLTEEHYFSTQISYRLGLTGPSVTVLSACSSSLGAIHFACRSLLMGECDIALAGGVSITLPINSGYQYHEGMMFSPDGHCRAFDEKAEGTVPGNGVGVVVLKLLDRAIEDRDNIYAVIKSTSMNNDGNKKLGYAVPGLDGQVQVIKAAYELAEISPEDYSFIEAHGTGTKLGDAIEVEALKLAFNSDKRSYCAIGSVKPNIGYLDAASGISSFIKAVMSIKNRMYPPTLHYSSSNPQIDFKNSPFFVNTQAIDFNDLERKVIAGVNSFGDGGTNVHIVLEEFKRNSNVKDNERDYYLIKLSARTKGSLKKMIKGLKEYLDGNISINLHDVEYTLNISRNNFENRVYFVCKSSKDFIEQVNKIIDLDNFNNLNGENQNDIAFIFGEMQSEIIFNAHEHLYRNFDVYREEFNNCLELLKGNCNNTETENLFSEVFRVNIEDNILINIKENKKDIIQFIFQYSYARFLVRLGIKPVALSGVGVGSLVCGCLMDIFDMESVIHLLCKFETKDITENIIGNIIKFKENKINKCFLNTNFVSGISGNYISDDNLKNCKLWVEHLKQHDKVNDETIRAIKKINCSITAIQNSDNVIQNTDNNFVIIFSEDKPYFEKRFLEYIGKMWKCGVEINWNEFYLGKDYYKVSLPTYPFERTKY